MPKVRWPNDARVAISIVLNYEEGSEYSHANGDGRNDGLTEVIYAMDPQVSRPLRRVGFRIRLARRRLAARAAVHRAARYPITFYRRAVALERNREVAAWLQGSRPRAVQPRLALGGGLALVAIEEEAEHIRRAIDSIKETCGERPSGWYCRYGPSVNTRELLVEEGGFVYDSDAYNDDLPYYVEVKGKRHLSSPIR